MTIHTLKIWPTFYQAVADGRKTFEIRINDRDFEEGDTVILREYDPAPEYGRTTGPIGFTEKYLTFKIGYVLPIDDKRVVFSLVREDR